ncbi:MAG: fused MFS/spermidine synthase [Phycisphaerae bacterium]|nr:fused MFS/spermidine synthase [Phycisphaerae bacterium]
MTQLTLMRELLCVFSGNEMIFGIILACWLLLTGIGARLGKTASKLKRPLSVLVAAQIFVGLAPIANVFILRVMPGVVFIRGAMISPGETVASCFILLLPYCLVAGYLLTLACSVLAAGPGASSIGRVYFLDAIGDVLGGLVFTFVLVGLLDHFGILYLPALLNLAFAVILAAKLRSKALTAAAGGIGAALFALIMTVDLDAASTRIQYAGRNVVFRGNSPYGNLVVTASHGQYDFIENGVPLFSTHEIEKIEETVHYAMAQRPTAKQVLVISGGVSGTANEILKYDPHRVDYVELDPLIIRLGRKYLPGSLSDPRIHVINTDGRLQVKTTTNRYDVIISDVPDPSTSQINRFYTRQFFQEAKAALRPGGVLCFSLGRYENYLSEELARLIGSVHRTVKEVFANVAMIPGGRVFFLASDGPLTTDIASAIEAADVNTQFVNRHYLSAALTPRRLAAVQRAVSDEASVNTDLSPVLYYYHLRYWISHFRVPFTIALRVFDVRISLSRFEIFQAAMILCFLVYVLLLKPVPLAIFTTGFAAAALEVVLIMAFQVLYGYVYEEMGLIVTMFMAGLAVGSLAMNRMLPRRSRIDLARLDLGIAVFAGALPLVLMAMGHVSGRIIADLFRHAAIPLLTFLLAVLVGMEFPLAGKVDFEGITPTAARLYSADLAGACLGAILVSTLLIPIIGVVGVCVLVAGINIVSALIVVLTGKT